MKHFISITLTLAACMLATVSCDDFLDRESKTTMNDNNFWTNENNIRLFVNGTYGSYFNGYSDNWGSVYAPGVFTGEYSDDRTTSGAQPNILLSVPKDNWYKAENPNRGYWLARRGAGPWNFAYIRKWNLLLERLETMHNSKTLSDEAYKHWSGVARFFRGWEYSRFVESFGDVPYQDHTISSDDFDAQYAPRNPRAEVMTHVEEDFLYALQNVRDNDGNDYVNKAVVGTIGARCMLFEGTWYIYHKNDEAMKTNTAAGLDIDAKAKEFLQAAVTLSSYVMNNYKFTFNTDFRTLFGSLYTRPASGEIILYRSYHKDVNSSSQHCIASYSNGNESQAASGNLSTIEAWICNDGQPYNSSTVADAKSFRLQDMVKTRDPRFEATFWDEPKNSQTGLYCEKFINREGVTYSYNGATRPTWSASCTNENGYPCVRYSETVLNWIEAKAELADKFGGEAVTQDDLDKSINAIRKRPLDAVAKAKGVKQTAPLMLASLPDDPARNSEAQKKTLGYKTRGEVPQLLWEIRRERRMEFFLEQQRPLDIRRWGQLELMLGANNPELLIGGWTELDLAATLSATQAADLGRTEQKTNLKKTLNDQGFNLLTKANIGKVAVIPIAGYNADGTIILGDKITFDGTNFDKMRGFYVPVNIKDRTAQDVDVRNYLEPICTDIINQYASKQYVIVQNPGWEQ